MPEDLLARVSSGKHATEDKGIADFRSQIAPARRQAGIEKSLTLNLKSMAAGLENPAYHYRRDILVPLL
jgi:hypothetical protein